MPSYERSAGEALELVKAWCRHLAGDSGFDDTTQPTLDEVLRFQDMAYYKIAGQLARIGYSVTQTNQTVLGWLQNLQAIETVIAVEIANPITGPGEPNDRFDEFARQRDSTYKSLTTDLLEQLGATRTERASSFVGVTGVSKDRDLALADDSDLIHSAISRGMHDNPKS